MSSYSRPLKCKPRNDGFYESLDCFRFYYDSSKTGEYVEIPKGFLSNGASIPTLFQKLFNWKPTSPYWIQAAFMHDGLVGENGVFLPVINEITSESRYVTWMEAADWFNKALDVKQKNIPDCPDLNRILFVKSVKAWGFIKLVTTKLKLSFLDKF